MFSGEITVRLAAAQMAEIGPDCVKSRSDAMILRVNRQGATDVRLRGGDRSEPEQFVSSPP